MKNNNRILVIILSIVVCLSMFAIYSFAETSDIIGSVKVFKSDTIGEPKVDIKSLINDKVTKEIVGERYNMGSLEKPEKYMYDTSVYLLEYNVGIDYWNSVTENNYKGLTEAIDYSYPTVYIPIFGDISDTKGEVHNRVTGYLKLQYDAFERDYRLTSSTYNLTSDYYKDRKLIGFFESISDYLNTNNIISEQVFLIKYPTSLSDGMEKIAIVKTTDDVFVLDISNSVNINVDGMSASSVRKYTVSDYKTLRLKAEKELYQKSDGWDDNPSAGQAPIQTDENHGVFAEKTIICICIVVILVCGITVFLLQKKQRNDNRK